MPEYTLFDFIKSLLTAYKGKRLWRRYNRLYKIKSRGDYLALLPTDTDEYNRIFFNYIDKCFEARKRVIILATDAKLEKIAPLYERKNELIVCPITPEDAKKLIAYYSFTPFYFRFYLLSLDEPAERKCSHLIGKKGITAEELIAVGIMGYDSMKYQKRGSAMRSPEYKGTDADIMGFLKSALINKEV